MTQLFPGRFLKTNPERYWLSSVMTGCPAGPPLIARVRGQETAASGLEVPPSLVPHRLEGVGEMSGTQVGQSW